MSFEPGQKSDEQLAQESQAGSLDAFEQLVCRYENRIYGFVLRSCSNTSDAREITQDAFVKAYEALAQYDSAKPFAPWLFTIARRKCIDHHRAMPREDATPVPEQADAEDPAELLARKEDREALWKCAHRLLPTAQFQALWLRYAEEMNVQQVAQVLRKTQTHVKVLLFRARQRLVSELKSPAPRLKHPLSQGHSSEREPSSRPGKNWEPASVIRNL